MPKQIRMPPGSPQYLKNLPNNLRVEPYPKSKPKKKANASKTSNADKENADADPKPKSRASKPKKLPEAQQQYSDWRDIELDETLGEIPCYDNAAAVRRKLKKLLADKEVIPCTDDQKKWTQASMNAEMVQLEQRDGAVEYNRNSRGPTVNTLGTFLKKTGNMGGGDSPSYYWGYVLCEKLRIWEGAKKTKAREEAEMRFPGGLVREDPDHCYVLAREGEVPVWEPQGRQQQHDEIQAFHVEMRELGANIRDEKSSS